MPKRCSVCWKNGGGFPQHTKEEALQGPGLTKKFFLHTKRNNFFFSFEFLWYPLAFCSKEPCVVYSECHDQADILFELWRHEKH